MIIRTCICLCVFLFLILSCAKQSTPTGGPKDSIPPILVRSFPANKQLNFKGKEISLTFSETVIVNNPKEQILITPSTGKDFNATAKNREVKIVFENDFVDSTTYSVNFRDAIQDITEKNPVRNLKLAFSTGNYIDSLSIDGNIYDLLTGKETKDATVALFPTVDTFNIFKHKPTYVTKTDEKGLFKIENLKPGIYTIYAFEDKNKNLIVDSKNESYGFKADSINLKTNIKKIAIPILKLDARPLKLSSARPYSNYFNIRTTKSLVNYTITADTMKIISSLASDRVNVKVFNYISGLDSLKVNFKAYDSIGNILDSTLYVKFNKRDAELEKFSMTTDDNKILANKGILELHAHFNKPIAKVNFDSIFFQPDSATIFHFTDEEMHWNFITNDVVFKKDIDKKYLMKEKEGQLKMASKTKPQNNIKNILTLGKSAFISVDDDSSASKKETIKILREEDTGVLIVQIQTDEKHFILELLSKEFKTLQTISDTKSFKIENLPPSSYMLRLTIDKNGNGKWDPGNFLKKEEPEPILFYKNEKKEPVTNLKANWEVGPMLIKY